MKQKLLSICFILTTLIAWSQTRYDLSGMSTEQLDRGVIAVRQTDGKVFVSWRILHSDQRNEAFDVYRDGKKLNHKPLMEGGSWFIDEQPTDDEAVYEVRGGNVNGTFSYHPETCNGYITIPLEKPEGGTTPDGQRFFYTANDASVGDVDGDGQYEIILKWDPSNSHDNAHDGYTGPTLLDCYKLFPKDTAGNHIVNGQSSNSKLLWRINLGHNIRSGAHYTPFIVYDLDGDGCAELMVKTADGTCDGKGRLLKGTVFDSSPAETIPDYRNPVGRILDGPEYITVFNGMTGEAMDTKPYVPERGELWTWGDNRGNRSERYLAGVGYLGNERKGERGERKKTASALFCRGYYTRTVISAWDWDGHELKQRWTFDTNDPEWKKYAGQGNHNLRIVDVDGDGLDEIIYGSMTVDHDGRGLYSTGMGHGDALHLVADHHDGRLYVWNCHENRRDGSDLHDAATGEVIFKIPSKTDVGRAMAADIDPTNPGIEMWSIDSRGIRNMKGEKINARPLPEKKRMGGGLSINFGIWWDGDLLRELLDHETITKYNWQTRRVDTVQRLDGRFNNGTKSNPCLSADIMGDWREEVIVRNRESTELRIYTTTIPTDYRINCLMQDIPYRLSVATENVGYNQPPETGIYLGPDKTDYLK